MLPGINALRADAGLAPLRRRDRARHAPRPSARAHGRAARVPAQRRCRRCSATSAPQVWEPEAETPDWLLEDGDPWVLVTCSTEYQGDEIARARRDRGPARRAGARRRDAGRRLRRRPAERAERPRRALRAARARCSSAPPPSSATAAWASCRSPSPRACRWPSCRSDATSPRSRGASVECGAGVTLPSKKLTPERLRTRGPRGDRQAPGGRGRRRAPARIRRPGALRRRGRGARRLAPARVRAGRRRRVLTPSRRRTSTKASIADGIEEGVAARDVLRLRAAQDALHRRLELLARPRPRHRRHRDDRVRRVARRELGAQRRADLRAQVVVELWRRRRARRTARARRRRPRCPRGAR